MIFVVLDRISKKDKNTGEIKHFNVNACLMPVLAADGCHVTTVEGIGTIKGGNMHPIQKAMTELHGSQCGKFPFSYIYTEIQDAHV